MKINMKLGKFLHCGAQNTKKKYFAKGEGGSIFFPTEGRTMLMLQEVQRGTKRKSKTKDV